MVIAERRNTVQEKEDIEDSLGDEIVASFQPVYPTVPLLVVDSPAIGSPLGIAFHQRPKPSTEKHKTHLITSSHHMEIVSTKTAMSTPRNRHGGSIMSTQIKIMNIQ